MQAENSMAGDRAQALLQRRKALAEHPFGTLNWRAGYRHFLVRSFAKVRGEWGLMALCYNFGRVLRIIGLERFITQVADLWLRIALWSVAAATEAVASFHPNLACRPLGGRSRTVWLPKWSTSPA
jgi:hypothetical protein